MPTPPTLYNSTHIIIKSKQNYSNSSIANRTLMSLMSKDMGLNLNEVQFKKRLWLGEWRSLIERGNWKEEAQITFKKKKTTEELYVI